jgi:RNA polymerase sigma factor (sigma-70 family)
MKDETRQMYGVSASAGKPARRAEEAVPGGSSSLSSSFILHPSSFLLYHFCRLQLPVVGLSFAVFERHLQRALAMYQERRQEAGEAASARDFLERLYPLDWFLACACLEGQARAWESLFASRASRTDTLLVDALRARAVRLFPRDTERQEEAVAEFWGFLLAGEREGSVPILARYDGVRPLVPWLIRVFQNKHLSDLRHRNDVVALPEAELGEPMPTDSEHERWYDEFRLAARSWLDGLGEQEVLILGLRLRYRMSQRDVASVLGIHEGNVSRQTSRLRDHCLEEIGRQLRQLGWTGDDLGGFLYKEMDSLLLDEPRLSADRLAALLARRGKAVPAEPGASRRGRTIRESNEE